MPHTYNRPVSWPDSVTDRRGYTFTIGQSLRQVVEQTDEATHSTQASVLASWLDRQTRGYTLTTSQCLGQVVGQTDEATHSP